MLVLAAAVSYGMAADPPELLGYQGVLRDAAGAPPDGTYDMIFRFTDTPTGGRLLLTDLHTGPAAVVVSGGLFTTLLGGGTLAPGTEASLQEIFSKYAPVYLEVQVVSETLAPRVQIVSTGFALNAGRLGGQLPGNYIDTGPALQVKEGKLIVDGGFIGGSWNPNGIAVLGEDGAVTGVGRGVQGRSFSDAGVGVLGSALSETGPTEGMRGQSTSPDGKGVVGVAFETSGLNYGVFGESQNSNGVGAYGRATSASGSTTGVGGESFSSLGTGVAGVAHAAGGDAWGVYGASTSPDGYGVVSDGDSVTAEDIYATGTKYFLTEHPLESDLAIRYACLEGEEIGLYRRGSGRLDKGLARVTIPEPFPLVASGRVTVQVTPLEECGGLYVEQDEVSASGFTVRELGGGSSNAAFT